MTEDARVLAGAKNAVINCMKVQPNEKVVIITDRSRFRLANIILDEVLKLNDQPVETGPGYVDFSVNAQGFVMEEFGPRPLTMPIEIMNAMRQADVSFYVATYCEGELERFRTPIYEWVVESKHLRHANMPYLNRTMLATGLNADYTRVAQDTEVIYQRLNGSQYIHVYSNAGTDLAIEVGKYKWAKCDGNIQPGTYSNLPDGEVFTAPTNVNGRIVFDGSLDEVSGEFGILRETPVSVRIKDCVAVEGSVRCPNSELAEKFSKYLFDDPSSNKNRIGEVAFGTNYAVTEMIASTLQDEKMIGSMHFAFGDALGDHTQSPYSSAFHLDCIITTPRVYVDHAPFLFGQNKYHSLNHY